MKTKRYHHPVIWIAVFAILMGVLSSSIASFHLSGTSNSWIEVCSSSGTKLVKLDDAKDQGNESPAFAHLGDHCPFCRLQKDLPVVAHTPSVMVVSNGSIRSVSKADVQPTPLCEALWPAHHTRAPPIFA